MSINVVTLGVVLLVGATLPHRGPVAPIQSDSAAVAAVVEQYHRSLATGDSAATLRLLADDAVILESGDVETRAEYRAHHLAADIEFARGVTSTHGPASVVTQGDVAWTICTSKARGTFGRRRINSQGAELMVLSREGGNWKIRAIHWSSHSLDAR
ncbi:MAG: DUF4440 domain-containing protein [Gemmatimonadales bacterium]